MVTLSDEEVVVLREALDRYLPELAFELARIKVMRDRHPLVELDERLRKLRARLETEPADARVI
jgi:hypothetical protein